MTLQSERVALRRKPERGAYDEDTVHAILDEGFVCHVGFVYDGQPYVIPTLYARCGSMLYLHGSPLSRMIGELKQGVDLCVTVTLIDGLVLARSAFHHSVNYRSVVVLGRGEEVTDLAEKHAVLTALVEHVIPGRSADARGPSRNELRATTVIAVPISEASAKIRTGPPIDTGRDLKLKAWAGVLPLQLRALEPLPDAQLDPTIATPNYIRAYTRP